MTAFNSFAGYVFILSVLVWSSAVYANKKERPDYLDEAAFIMFMANETTKYCENLVPDEKAFDRFQEHLSQRLTEDGISNPQEEVEPMPLATIVLMGTKEMEKKGGPFMFNAEKWCQYGRNEIKNKSEIGLLLKEDETLSLGAIFRRFFGQ
ncbi:hypothetical protein BTA51_20035 [Hahella sp. CCB-MM4]|uniref:DUF5333 family protein n=1 Tax=Hahella sp. (strain CCB-MM4) TaxID=1926491 RepID=UPI000B9AE106|nr:DUF5333 family protein [Hahella sp. CCB-MM4]OZG71574.1 hypothetical protein BTA51_20035 [Hahella sp. CCB-MM4]